MGLRMSLHQSLTRAGFPVDLSHYFGYGLDFGTAKMVDDLEEYGVRTWRDYLADWYTHHTISRAHMKYLLEVINYIKFNRAKYLLYKQIGRNRSYGYKHTLIDSYHDSDFLQDLNSIARKMSHADDPLPLINYTGDLFLIDTRRQPLETRYSDTEFRRMTENIRQHLADEPGYLLESQQINQREAGILDGWLERHPFWTFGELYSITSLNYPKAFK